MRTTWNQGSPFDRDGGDVMGALLGTATSPRTFSPEIDVRTNDDEVVFTCDVPGMKSGDLELVVDQHVLTLKGKRMFEARDGEQIMLGRAYGAFARAFELPEGLDEERLAADLADGVLTIRIPKQPKAKARKIDIGGGKR
jgi:HSP20 family protein